MRLVVFDDLPEGGAKRVVFEQVKRLSLNHEINWMTNTVKSQFPFEQYVHDKTEFEMELSPRKGISRPLTEVSFYTKLMPVYRRLNDLINQIRPDMVIVHPSRFSQAPWLLTMIHRPTLYFAEEWLRLVYEPGLHPLPQQRTKRWYEQGRRRWLKHLDYTSTRAASQVVVTSSYMETAFTRTYHLRPIRIPLGVDLGVFKPREIAKEDNYFLFIGEAQPINGYPLLQQILNKYPVKRIGFKGVGFRYTDTQLAHLYQGAIATLCLADHEPFGLIPLESMACRTPVIAVGEGGYLDTVVPYKTGIVIRRDSKDLIKAMDRLHNDKTYRDKLGNAGQNYVVKHYNWDTHVRRLEQTIESMIYD